MATAQETRFEQTLAGLRRSARSLRKSSEMKPYALAFSALLFVSAAAAANAGGLDAAYADPIVTAPAGVAGISVRQCSDEPGFRRSCDGGDGRVAAVTRDTPRGPKDDTPTPEEPPVHVDPEDCPKCEAWRKEYEWKKENKPWLDNPKWSPDKYHPNRPTGGKSKWEECIGDEKAAKREAKQSKQQAGKSDRTASKGHDKSSKGKK